MKAKHFINLHKGLTSLFVIGLMFYYQNFTVGAWVYLALHGTYGLLWLLKDRIYPDKQWEQEISPLQAVVAFFILGAYWVAPFILISSGKIPPVPLIAAAISLNILGVFLLYASGAQKYFTLKYQPGLITEGFFARCRNTNYLGDILIYTSFAMLAMHWLPFLILELFFAAIFLPNMMKKEESLSRYVAFEAYQKQSGLLFPKLFIPNQTQTDSVALSQKES